MITFYIDEMTPFLKDVKTGDIIDTEGIQAVCEIMERYEAIAANKAVKIANVQKVIRMLEKNYPKEEILELGFTEEEFSEAEKQLLQLV